MVTGVENEFPSLSRGYKKEAKKLFEPLHKAQEWEWDERGWRRNDSNFSPFPKKGKKLFFASAFAEPATTLNTSKAVELYGFPVFLFVVVEDVSMNQPNGFLAFLSVPFAWQWEAEQREKKIDVKSFQSAGGNENVNSKKSFRNCANEFLWPRKFPF